MTGSPGFSHATEIPSLFGAWLNEMRTQILNKSTQIRSFLEGRSL